MRTRSTVPARIASAGGLGGMRALSEGTQDPRRRIPIAILLCAFAGGTLYIFQSYLADLVFPNYRSFADHQDVADSAPKQAAVAVAPS